jgi:hypothetical protein
MLADRFSVDVLASPTAAAAGDGELAFDFPG